MKPLFLILLLVTIAIPTFAQYSSPESAVYDVSNSRWLISNAGNGRILQRTADGNVANFATNLSAPKGLCVVGDTLYVADETRIRAYWLANRQAVFTLNVPNSTFLNDLATDGVYLYVTDMSRNRISRMRLTTREIETYVSEGITSPNGLFFDGEHNRMILVSYRANSPVQAVDLENGAVSVVINTQLSNLDGIARDGNGYYYISSWGTGAVYRFAEDFSHQTMLLDSLEGPADIFYDTTHNILAIPCMSAHQVIFRDTPPPGAQLNAPGTLNFGEIDARTRSTLELEWRNSGSEVLAIDSVRFQSDFFLLDVERNLRIDPEESVNIPVTFSPVDTNEYADTAWIYSNEPRSPRRLILLGKGFPAPWLIVPESHDFGRVRVGEQATWDLTLENGGELELWLDSIPSHNFILRAELPQNVRIAPGASEVAQVTFAPGSREPFDDTLKVWSSDPNSPAKIIITGRGYLPANIIIDREHDFGNVPFGGSAEWQAGWMNNGDDTTRLDSIQHQWKYIFGADLPQPPIIPPGDTVYTTMSFVPKDTIPRFYSDTLRVYSNDPDSPIWFILKGFGGENGVRSAISPMEFSLSEGFPSPFNSSVVFHLSLPASSEVAAGLYDVQGRMVKEIVNGRFEAGVHSLSLSGDDIGAGTYFVKGSAGTFTFSRKIVLLK